MTTRTADLTAGQPKPWLDKALWTAQGLLALVFIGGGAWKVVTPIDDLAAAFPWAGEVPEGLVRGTAALDIVGGLGLLVPSVLRIRPSLAVAAAVGCAALMASAAVFHISRGEAADTPLNLILAGVALFVAWGRQFKVPLQPRG